MDDMRSAARVRAHMEFLADDLLEGRGAGTLGYDLAAKHVASVLRTYGFEPGRHRRKLFPAGAIAPEPSRGCRAHADAKERPACWAKPLTYDVWQADKKAAVEQDLSSNCQATYEVSLK